MLVFFHIDFIYQYWYYKYMSRPNDERNKELVKLRNKDPKKWTFAALAEKFEISVPVASKIYHRDKDRF